MSKLKTISFAGIDRRTPVSKLRELQDQFPLVEWGILLSDNWEENGNRFWNPCDYRRLDGLNICGHLCGKIARAAAENNMEPLYALLPQWKTLKRIQLNIAPYGMNCQINWDDPEQELYVQCRPGRYENYLSSTGANMLIDGSGGTGKAEDWTIFPSKKKIGYAGGLNPENVREKTLQLINSPEVSDFWIDMESGVRNDEDWFDVKKAEQVLLALKELI